MPTCPNCNGQKESRVLVKPSHGDCYETIIPCRLCKGQGEVDAQVMDWVSRGESIRKARIASGEGQREAARRLGLDPIEYNHIEHGRADPGIIERLAELRNLERKVK